VNSGIVRPGDSPGTLTVNGNYAQTAAGTLRIEVASVTEHGLLAVGGHASLAGTLQLIGLGGFTLHVGDQLTFLTANGGVSGNFGTVQNEISTGTVAQAQIVTLPNSVLLEGTQGSFVPAACNPNSAAVAQALDSAVGNPRASALIAFLNEQAFNNLCGDFTLIAPEALASIFDAGVSFANVQTANLKRRLEDVRAGDNGFNSSGFSLNGGTSNFSTGLAGVTGPEGKSGPSVMAPTPENRWGIWVTGLGEFANVSSTNEAAGFDIQTGGVTFGVDYRVCSIFAVGLTAGYANMNADLPNGGSLDVNSGQFGLYATLFGKGFYADAAITGGPSGYDSRRTALLGSANGNTGGGNFNVLAAVGYDWTKGGLSVGPTANFQYTYVGISGFTESGSIAPLNIDSQNVESERTAIGMKASYEWKVGHVIIKPEISAAWQHEFGDQSYSIVSSFANGAGNSFTVSSPPIGRDSLLIGAGTAVLLNDRLSIYAYYDGELLRTNYQSNDVSAGVRLTF
jgi:outer membrane autotransporter protein